MIVQITINLQLHLKLQETPVFTFFIAFVCLAGVHGFRYVKSHTKTRILFIISLLISVIQNVTKLIDFPPLPLVPIYMFLEISAFTYILGTWTRSMRMVIGEKQSMMIRRITHILIAIYTVGTITSIVGLSVMRYGEEPVSDVYYDMIPTILYMIIAGSAFLFCIALWEYLVVRDAHHLGLGMKRPQVIRLMCWLLFYAILAILNLVPHRTVSYVIFTLHVLLHISLVLPFVPINGFAVEPLPPQHQEEHSSKLYPPMMSDPRFSPVPSMADVGIKYPSNRSSPTQLPKDFNSLPRVEVIPTTFELPPKRGNYPPSCSSNGSK
jgi:hypothetical protein